jgi:hypothetical protein
MYKLLWISFQIFILIYYYGYNNTDISIQIWNESSKKEMLNIIIRDFYKGDTFRASPIEISK